MADEKLKDFTRRWDNLQQHAWSILSSLNLPGSTSESPANESSIAQANDPAESEASTSGRTTPVDDSGSSSVNWKFEEGIGIRPAENIDDSNAGRPPNETVGADTSNTGRSRKNKGLNDEGRWKVLTTWKIKTIPRDEGIDWGWLVDKSNGFNGTDLHRAINRAVELAQADSRESLSTLDLETAIVEVA